MKLKPLKLVLFLPFISSLLAPEAQALQAIVNRSVSQPSITLENLGSIFKFETENWANGKKISIVSFDSSLVFPKANEPYLECMGQTLDKFKAKFSKSTFRGEMNTPVFFEDNLEALIKKVNEIEGAIAILPDKVILEGAKFIEIKN